MSNQDKAVEAAGPTMPKTLADYSPDEREQMVGMWCDFSPPNIGNVGKLAIYAGEVADLAVIVIPSESVRAGSRTLTTKRQLAPCPDLPRAWQPDGSPSPHPAKYSEEPK